MAIVDDHFGSEYNLIVDVVSNFCWKVEKSGIGVGIGRWFLVPLLFLNHWLGLVVVAPLRCECC